MPVAPTEALKPFLALGQYVKQSSGSNQALGDCILCNREGKFHVNVENGGWDCKKCGRKGNPIQFLRQMWEVSYENTTEEQYQELAQKRKYITTLSLRTWGACVSVGRGEWILPGFYTDSQEVKQLYRYTDYGSKDNKFHLSATKGFGLTLYGANLFDDKKEDVYICEGPWDAIALWETLRMMSVNSAGNYEYTADKDSSLLANANVVAVPSANTFEEHWARLLQGKRVFFLLDNDHPREEDGRVDDPVALQGIRRMMNSLREWGIIPKETWYCAWGGSAQYHDMLLPSGYDIRDLLSENYGGYPKNKTELLEAIDSRAQQLSKLRQMCQPVPETFVDTSIKVGSKKRRKGKEVPVDMLPCDKWDVLMESWERAYVFHAGMKKGLLTSLSGVASTMLPGDQLWMKFVAPPSSGKTEICNALTQHGQYVVAQSHFTGFYSGIKPEKKEDGQEELDDYGMLAQIHMKAFVTKDGDTLLQNLNLPQILSQARDLYDGSSSTHFKNNTGKKYEWIRTVWLLYGTESLRGLDRSELGERFIDCVLPAVNEALQRKICYMSMEKLCGNMRPVDPSDKTHGEDKDKMKARRMTAGYIEYLRSLRASDKIASIGKLAKDDEDVKSRIYDLARFVSYMRSRPSERQGEGAHKEMPTRLCNQFIKLGNCLALVMGKTQIDRDVLGIVKTIAMDTARGDVMRMVENMTRNKRTTEMALLDMLALDKREATALIRHLIRIDAFNRVKTLGNGHFAGDEYIRLSSDLSHVCELVWEG